LRNIQYQTYYNRVQSFPRARNVFLSMSCSINAVPSLRARSDHSVCT